MKKYRLFTAVFVALFGAASANAQTFTINKDTSNGYWASGAGDVEMHITPKNTSASNIQIDWRISYLNKGTNWTFVSLCDKVLCYGASTAGLADGSKTFTDDVLAPGADGDFKVAFNGDAAANGTKSMLTIEMKSGGTTNLGTFVAYKTAAGITNSFIQDNDIAVFPNPAQNYIDVVYNASSDVKTIAIYNLIGKVVSVYKVTNKNSARCEFNSEMPSGIYVLRIADSKGNVIATRKITRQ